MKGIGLFDPENLNAYVCPHRTRRGGANPGFRASRVCPNRLSFANFIFEFKIKIKFFQLRFVSFHILSCPRKGSLPKDFLMMINSLYKGSFSALKNRTQPSSSSLKILKLFSSSLHLWRKQNRAVRGPVHCECTLAGPAIIES